MSAILCELRRAFLGKWFWGACFGTLTLLWLGIGSDSYWILTDNEYLFSASRVIREALASESSVLSLPALAALPCAANVLKEFACGAMRLKVFRCGRRGYRLGKIINCALAAVLSQFIGVLLFCVFIYGVSLTRGAELMDIGNIAPLAGARLLSAAAFACFGAVIALVSRAQAAAYVAPLAACFALKLLGSRFFIGVKYIDPAEWLAGGAGAVRVMLIICILALAALDAALRRGMNKYA